MTPTPHILLVEDNPADADLIREMIDEAESGPFEVVHVIRLGDTLGRLAAGRFVVILLDLSLPDSHGLQTLAQMQRHAAGTPIVVLTGLDDRETAVAAVRAGAQDYLVKGTVDAADLDRAIQFAMERTRALLTMRESERHLQTSIEALTNQVAILLDLNRQATFGGLVQAVAHAGRRLGVSSHTGVLLRDPGTDAWYLTAFFDANGRPVDMTAIGLPSGPFRFEPPPDAAPRPVAQVLAPICGVREAEQVALRLGSTGAICAAIPGPQGWRGALLALPATPERASLLANLVAYAAPSAARLLDLEAPAEADGVLDARAFTPRAADELERAIEFRRKASVVAIVCESLGDLSQVAPQVARSLGRWDMLGRIDQYPPALAALLPEADRNDVLNLVNRLGTQFPRLQLGAATYPDDGTSLQQLIEMARGRATHVRAAAWGAPDDGGVRWVRGAPAGPSANTVRCPICAAPYTRQTASRTTLNAEEAERDAAREELRSTCPRHHEVMTVSGGARSGS